MGWSGPTRFEPMRISGASGIALPTVQEHLDSTADLGSGAIEVRPHEGVDGSDVAGLDACPYGADGSRPKQILHRGCHHRGADTSAPGLRRKADAHLSDASLRMHVEAHLPEH